MPLPLLLRKADKPEAEIPVIGHAANNGNLSFKITASSRLISRTSALTVPSPANSQAFLRRCPDTISYSPSSFGRSVIGVISPRSSMSFTSFASAIRRSDLSVLVMSENTLPGKAALRCSYRKGNLRFICRFILEIERSRRLRPFVDRKFG